MITVSDLSLNYSGTPLFSHVDLQFLRGNCYGIIGANGAGKSTFLKILSGDLEPSTGEVSILPNTRMSVLKQNQNAYDAYNVMDTVIMGNQRLYDIGKEKEALYAKEEMTDEDGMRACQLEEEYAELGGWESESDASRILQGLGIGTDLHDNDMATLDARLKVKVLLAQALFGSPDLLMMDEPTNNLDINTIRWLEDVLNERNSTMVIISHDRHFLNQVCTHMADLDYGKITIYPGNYDDFMEASSQARERQQNANAKAKERVAELQEFVRRFSANKSKAKQATSRLKLIDKIKPEDVKPSSRQYPWIRFDFDEKDKLHRLAVEIENLNFGYDAAKPLFKNFTCNIEAGDKIAVIGENGVGKTTFLKLLLGQLQPSYGTIKWAEKAKPGYYAQDHASDFAEDKSLTDWITEFVRQGGYEGGDVETLIRGTLGRLLFSGDEVKKSVKVISGGEQGRMLFGKLMLLHSNVLLLDEPTNHLDMESIESLNTALDLFKGTLVFVSHDREFVSSLATRIIEIKADGIVDYKGTYEEYLSSQGIE